jgi:hypothetical protein
MVAPGDDPIRLRAGVEWRTVSGEVVALDLESSAYLAVNGTGSILWPLVASGTTTARLVDELVTRFDIDADDARRDVGAFLDSLRSLSLVEVVA